MLKFGYFTLLFCWRRQRIGQKWKTHVQGVQSYCFCPRNMQICDFFVTVAVIVADLRPGQTLATCQHNTLQHCCMMLRHVLHGVAKFIIFNATYQCSCAPGPWCARSGPNAHALRQQCVNVAKRVQHHATSKMLHATFDRFQMWSNMLQHIATGWPNVCNMLYPTMLQDVALKCCERLARP